MAVGRCRNTNYLGEVLIYLSFAIMDMHWLPNRQATPMPWGPCSRPW
jgi:hypothetical protein